ncbi:hypothetical protein FNV43_RR07474 [Rhamnella rubrinervis]|uniref:Uncharacterized protein n=1 Tax=Rhamnella rubrinervis TaxID=2594499 RepID=A0A8K0HGM7_9ROSA|nr:hypothetical protein FNV43_RR07474 [Rhamnella rubrinervis]
MATSSSIVMRAWMLIILIFSVHVVSSAYNYQNRKTQQKRIDSAALLRALVYDLPKVKRINHHRREMEDRTTPGGPNHEHHP